MSDDKLTFRAGIAALLTIAWAALLIFLPPKYPFPHDFHHDIDSPILALEISRGGGDINQVLRPGPTPQAEAEECDLGTGDHNPTAAACEAQAHDYEFKSNELDLIFIPLYAFFLWSSARVFTQRTRLLALLILGAAAFDYLEDWQIFQALNGMSPAIYVPSLIKWALLGLVLFSTGIILLRSKSAIYSLPTKRLLSIAYFLSGVLLLLAVAFGSWIGYSLIELATTLFSVVLVVHVIGFLGHYVAIPGIQQKFVENFCEERKKAGQESLIAVKAEPAGKSDPQSPIAT